MSEPHSEKSKFQWQAEEAQRPERAIVVIPEFNDEEPRSRNARIEEAIGLAQAINLEVVEAGIIPIKRITPATLLGSGKVDELAGIIKTAEAGLAIIDHQISPKQQQNLEKAWNCKVLDRTGLILEIFGARAKTKEGRLQVELAHLKYQKGRLVRTWTHLERQRGGLSFVGGPGETQIEADRRMLQEKINRLEKDIEKVRKTRTLHRATRKKVPYPIVALVGYTNAGKSTLFNRLTGADVFAKDLLFATLDPTLRHLKLPNGSDAIFSDTVGFVSNLPTHLVAAFRATLEEVLEADLILHVRDISHDDREAQSDDVYDILRQLDIDEKEQSERLIEVWNKSDQLDNEILDAITERIEREKKSDKFLISATTGQGVDALLAEVGKRIASRTETVRLHITPDAMSIMSELYDQAQVTERTDLEDGSVELEVTMPVALKAKYSEFIV